MLKIPSTQLQTQTNQIKIAQGNRKVTPAISADKPQAQLVEFAGRGPQTVYGSEGGVDLNQLQIQTLIMKRLASLSMAK